MEASPRPNITVAAASDEPEAQPGVQPGAVGGSGTQITPPPPPDDDVEPDMGGPLPNATADEMVAASGGGLADRLKARFDSIAATEEFDVPGWEMEDGSPGLILVAKTFGDRKAYAKGVEHEVFIAKSTYKLLFVNDDGSREEIPGGWGPALAEMIGSPHITKAADLIRRVISKPDPDNPERRIPNVAGIGTLAQEIVLWGHKRTRDAEDDLGE